MKLITLLACLIFTTLTMAEDQILLIPADGKDGPGLVVEDSFIEISQTEVNKDDSQMLEEDFGQSNFVRNHLSLEGQVTAFVMALGARGSVGVRMLSDHLEVGVDGGFIFIAAGKDGAFSPELGTYVKVRLNPASARTVYFKGRAYKAWGLSEHITSTFEYGVGMENNRGSFLELSVRQISFDDDDTGYIPFINMGVRFGGPRPRQNDGTYLEEDD